MFFQIRKGFPSNKLFPFNATNVPVFKGMFTNKTMFREGGRVKLPKRRMKYKQNILSACRNCFFSFPGTCELSLRRHRYSRRILLSPSVCSCECFTITFVRAYITCSSTNSDHCRAEFFTVKALYRLTSRVVLFGASVFHF